VKPIKWCDTLCVLLVFPTQKHTRTLFQIVHVVQSGPHLGHGNTRWCVEGRQEFACNCVRFVAIENVATDGVGREKAPDEPNRHLKHRHVPTQLPMQHAIKKKKVGGCGRFYNLMQGVSSNYQWFTLTCDCL
jgi:hypothetical protein